MLSPLSRGLRGGGPRERSPFSSPYSNLLASPIAARRRSLEERRRPAAKFGDGPSPGPPVTEPIEEEDNEDDQDGDDNPDEEEEEEDEDEDDHGELSPLLPIFSAAHLGTGNLSVGLLFTPADPIYRFAASLPPHSHYTSAHCTQVRDHSDLGPIKIPSGLPIPCQTDTAADQDIALLKSYALCLDGELFAIHQRGRNKPWQ